MSATLTTGGISTHTTAGLSLAVHPDSTGTNQRSSAALEARVLRSARKALLLAATQFVDEIEQAQQ